MVPADGLEPSLLSEPHFECGVSTDSTMLAQSFQHVDATFAGHR